MMIARTQTITNYTKVLYDYIYAFYTFSIIIRSLCYLNGKRTSFRSVIFIIKEFSKLINPIFEVLLRNSTLIVIYYNLL